MGPSESLQASINNYCCLYKILSNKDSQYEDKRIERYRQEYYHGSKKKHNSKSKHKKRKKKKMKKKHKMKDGKTNLNDEVTLYSSFSYNPNEDILPTLHETDTNVKYEFIDLDQDNGDFFDKRDTPFNESLMSLNSDKTWSDSKIVVKYFPKKTEST